jgi:hypothetical protein
MTSLLNAKPQKEAWNKEPKFVSFHRLPHYGEWFLQRHTSFKTVPEVKAAILSGALTEKTPDMTWRAWIEICVWAGLASRFKPLGPTKKISVAARHLRFTIKALSEILDSLPSI